MRIQIWPHDWPLSTIQYTHLHTLKTHTHRGERYGARGLAWIRAGRGA